MTAKELAREKYLQLRREHPASEKHAADISLRAKLKTFLADLRTERKIMAYRPLLSEADPFDAEVTSGWVYPRVNGADLEAYEAGADTAFSKSSFGVKEPDPKQARRVSADEIGLVLIPGLAFDRQGHRLGFGKGYYDRFLKSATHPIGRVGVAYSFQVSPQGLPKDEWDEQVDWILTERFVLHVERKG